jgi:hypothetical protein
MSFDPEKLPKRVWLGAAALMLLLTVLATALFWPKLHLGRGRLPEGDASGQPPPRAMQSLRPQLRQSAEEGSEIAWGGVAPGYSVELEVTGLDPDWHGKAAFTLALEGGLISHVEENELNHLFRGLAPGRYRWSVQITNADGSVLPLAPPRTSPEGLDFIIPPRILMLTNLAEAQLDGSVIGDDLHSENGANLSATANPLPEAVVDFEVKPSGKSFDGSGVQSVPVGPDGSARLPFQSVEGDYHWRARSTAPGYASSVWVALRRTSSVDFHITIEDAENPPEQKPPQQNQPPPGPQLPGGVSASSDSGGGRSQPLPAVPLELPSFASLLLTPWSIGLAVLVIGFSCWRWLHSWRGKAGK